VRNKVAIGRFKMAIKKKKYFYSWGGNELGILNWTKLKEFKVESVSKTFFFERKNLRLLFKSDSKYKKKKLFIYPRILEKSFHKNIKQHNYQLW